MTAKRSVVLVLVSVAFVSAIFMGRHWLRTANARDAFQTAIGLMNPDVEFDSELASLLEIPEEIQSRDQAIEYFFYRAATLRPDLFERGYLLLGLHLLPTDCEKAISNLARYADARKGEDPDAAEYLEMARREGCESAYALVQESYY